MACDICDNKYKENILFENDNIIIMLALNPATSGHIQVFPRKHYTIIEQVPDPELEYVALVANKMSMLLFELLKVHGTNIIIQNGVPAGQTMPHVSINIIPRRTDDGLKLDWDMKQANPESLDSMHRIINEGLILSDPAKTTPQPATTTDLSPTTETIKPESSTQTDGKIVKKTNYYLKSIERIP